MFDDFLNHRCNIYHLTDGTVDVGYGIRKNTTRETEGTASETDVPCHFQVKASDTLRIVQDEPFSALDGEIKLTLPAGTDIRENDTVESQCTGLKYRAGVPREIHGGHHITVKLYREGGVKSAI